jgi:hypothetical protein
LTLVDGDSTVDPAIAHKVPQNGSKSTITVVEPQTCRR